jgi:hypothetical protein
LTSTSTGPERLADRLERLADLLAVGDVGRDGEGVAVGVGADLPGQVLDVLRRAGEQTDVTALGGEPSRERRAEARTDAGDDSCVGHDPLQGWHSDKRPQYQTTNP